MTACMHVRVFVYACVVYVCFYCQLSCVGRCWAARSQVPYTLVHCHFESLAIMSIVWEQITCRCLAHYEGQLDCPITNISVNECIIVRLAPWDLHFCVVFLVLFC